MHPPSPNPNPTPTPTPPSPGPSPPPSPAPNPAPNPEPEDGRFALAKTAYRLAKQVNRPAEAMALAEAFLDTSAKVNEGKLSGKLWIIKELQAATAKAIPDASQVHWQTARQKLNSGVRILYGSGQLASDTDWADCFAEIGRGLKAAAP